MLEKLPAGLGEALQGQRAGLENTVFERVERLAELCSVQVSSSVLGADRLLPIKYTADGSGISPPLEWHGIAPQTTHVAVLVEDADSPTPHPLVHAIVVNVDPRESSLVEGALNSPDHVGVGLETGPNSFLSHAWLPPDPPPGHGLHRYVFQVFALQGPRFQRAPGREELVRTIEDRCVASGYCIGTYERPPPLKSREPALDREEPVGAEVAPA